MSLENKLEKSSLLKQATFVDIFDGIVGPLCYVAYSSGSEYLSDFSSVLSIAELVLIKVPFIVSYLAKTKDYSALLYWAPKEFISNYVPIGSLIDIIPAYIGRVNHFEKK